MITIATRMRAATKGALVPIAEIDFPANARPTHAKKVSELVKSIRLIGLQSMPPWLSEMADTYLSRAATGLRPGEMDRD